jgi:hypothetical protein
LTFARRRRRAVFHHSTARLARESPFWPLADGIRVEKDRDEGERAIPEARTGRFDVIRTE